MPEALPAPTSVMTPDHVAPGAGARPPVPVVILDEAMLATGFMQLRSAVSHLLRSGAPTLTIDISGVERLSSPTVSALLWAQRRCRAVGSWIVLRGASRRTVRTLHRTGLEQVFEIESTISEGRSAGR